MMTLGSFKRDWPQFKREGLVFGITLLVILAMLLVTKYYLAQAEVTQTQSREQLDASTVALANIEQERTDLIASQPRYKRLVERHIIGAEDRLAWRDLLENAAVQHRLSKLSYSLTARAPLNNASTAPGVEPEASGAGAFKRYYARMSLQARFESEHGFIDLLDDLSDGAHAILVTRACHIKRGGGEEVAKNGSLQAECHLDWITFERSVATGQPLQGGEM